MRYSMSMAPKSSIARDGHAILLRVDEEEIVPERVGSHRGEEAIGLCASCRHMRRVETERGSVFYRCARAVTDPRFPKYPPLPVVRCEGYETDDGS
jgi:hypothetical protein